MLIFQNLASSTFCFIIFITGLNTIPCITSGKIALHISMPLLAFIAVWPMLSILIKHETKKTILFIAMNCVGIVLAFYMNNTLILTDIILATTSFVLLFFIIKALIAYGQTIPDNMEY